ncbi:MAG: hypothetical protein QXL18_05515, partial [Candidatus Woesearchaeota archaeon]
LNYDLSNFPDTKFTKFRLKYKIKRRMTCQGPWQCGGGILGKTNPGSENCIMYYMSGVTTLESNDDIKFIFQDDNTVKLQYGLFTHTYSQLHNQDYVTLIFDRLTNHPKPVIGYCPPMFTQGTRPIYLIPHNGYLNGLNLKIESSYNFIRGNNPFLSFPRLNMT